MKIMTKEYCLQCPLFNKKKGWLESDDKFWEENPGSGCMCKECPRKESCEAEGPQQDRQVCFAENSARLDAQIGESIKYQGVKVGKG